MPFGLNDESAMFQRAIKMFVQKRHLENVVNYFDDTVVHYVTFVEQFDILLTALRVENIRLKLRKCHFACINICYLRHTISKGSTSPKKSNIVAFL